MSSLPDGEKSTPVFMTDTEMFEDISSQFEGVKKRVEDFQGLLVGYASITSKYDAKEKNNKSAIGKMMRKIDDTKTILVSNAEKNNNLRKEVYSTRQMLSGRLFEMRSELNLQQQEVGKQTLVALDSIQNRVAELENAPRQLSMSDSLEKRISALEKANFTTPVKRSYKFETPCAASSDKEVSEVTDGCWCLQ